MGLFKGRLNTSLLIGSKKFNPATLRINLDIGRFKRPSCIDFHEKRLCECLPDSIIPKENLLVYSFNLRRAKKIGIFLDKHDIYNYVEKVKKFKENGICFYNLIDHQEGKFSFQFVIIDSYLFENNNVITIEKFLLHSTFRVIVLVKDTTKQNPYLNELINKRQVITCTYNDFEFYSQNKSIEALSFSIQERCWQIWLNKKWRTDENDNMGNLIIYWEDPELSNNWEEQSQINLNRNWRRIINLYNLNNQIEETYFEKIVDELNKENKIVCFDHHGRLYNRLFKNTNKFSGNDCYIMFGKSSPDFGKLAYVNDNPFLIYELMEAGLTKVLILDERIAQDSLKFEDFSNIKLHNRENDKTRLFDYYWASNIFVCTHYKIDSLEVNLAESPIYDIAKLKTEDINFPYLELNINSTHNHISFSTNHVRDYKIAFQNIDFLIIHRTVLKKIIDDDNTEINESDKLFKILRSHFSYIIVNSGGGYPSELGNNFKFIPFSGLIHYFNHRELPKYSLIKDLMIKTKN